MHKLSVPKVDLDLCVQYSTFYHIQLDLSDLHYYYICRTGRYIYIHIHVDVDYASTALDLARSGSSFADFV